MISHTIILRPPPKTLQNWGKNAKKPNRPNFAPPTETHFKVTPDACGNSVFRTSARILVPINDMNPMAIADSGASHRTALFDSKAAKPVSLRLAAGEPMQLRHIERSLPSMSLYHFAH